MVRLRHHGDRQAEAWDRKDTGDPLLIPDRSQGHGSVSLCDVGSARVQPWSEVGRSRGIEAFAIAIAQAGLLTPSQLQAAGATMLQHLLVQKPI